MARTPRRSSRIDDDDDGAGVRLPSPLLAEDPAEVELREIRAQYGGSQDVQIKVYKVNAQGKDEYCSTFPSAQDANEENVRALGYGDGAYNLRVVIGGEFRTRVPMFLAKKAEAVTPGQGPQTTQESLMLQFMKETNARQERMIELLLTRGASAEREPVSQLVDAVAKMQALNAPKETSIDTIMKCIELGKSLQSGGAEDDSLSGTIKDVLKSAAPVLAQGLMARGLPGQVQEPTRTIAPAQSNPPGEPDVQAMTMQLKLGIAFLKRKCLAGSDPNLYLHLILDNADQPQYQALLHGIATKDFATFVSVDEEIGREPFDKWFRFIYDGLRSATKAVDTVDDNSGGEGGNDGDAQRDVKPRKRRGKQS